MRQYFAQISCVSIGKAADAFAVSDARARQGHAGIGAANICDQIQIGGRCHLVLPYLARAPALCERVIGRFWSSLQAVEINIDKAVRAAAEKLQLGSLLDRLPKELSGSQRPRVAIGRAIVRDTKVFLVDGPLSNLDAALRVATRLEIAQLKEVMPETAMIYVTYDQVEAMTLASGGIVQVGAPLDLYERPNSTLVARFISSPAMNWLSGEVVGEGKTTKIRADQGGGIITAAILTQKCNEGMKVEIGILPKGFILAEGDDFAYEGRVGITEALGEVTLLYFDSKGSTGDDPVIVKLSGIYPSKRGEELRLGVAPKKIYLFHKRISLFIAEKTCFCRM